VISLRWGRSIGVDQNENDDWSNDGDEKKGAEKGIGKVGYP